MASLLDKQAENKERDVILRIPAISCQALHTYPLPPLGRFRILKRYTETISRNRMLGN
jgi:hypothetical protein